MGTLFHALLVIGAPAVLGTLGVIVCRSLMRGRIRAGHNDVLVPIFLNAGVLFAVVLGFMVIAVWESYDAAKSTVSQEAATLVTLYRTTFGLPEETGDKLRGMATEYAKAVIEKEWSAVAATGEGSLAARGVMGRMFHAFSDGTITQETKDTYPFLSEAFLTAVTEVTAARNNRIIRANESLPWAMWMATIGGAIIVMAMGCLLHMERAGPHALMSAGLGAMIGLLLFTCQIMSHPFTGPLAISAEPFEATLRIFQEADAGH